MIFIHQTRFLHKCILHKCILHSELKEAIVTGVKAASVLRFQDVTNSFEVWNPSVVIKFILTTADIARWFTGERVFTWERRSSMDEDALRIPSAAFATVTAVLIESCLSKVRFEWIIAVGIMKDGIKNMNVQFGKQNMFLDTSIWQTAKKLYCELLKMWSLLL